MSLGTFIVLVILICICALAVRSLVRDKKKGIGSCGLDCSCCALADSCSQTQSKHRRRSSVRMNSRK